MARSAGTIRRIVLPVTCPLKELYIRSWQWFQLDIGVSCVAKAKVQPPCCCVICVSEVGIWHVFGRHWPIFLKERGSVHVVENDLHLLSRTCRTFVASGWRMCLLLRHSTL